MGLDDYRICDKDSNSKKYTDDEDNGEQESKLESYHRHPYRVDSINKNDTGNSDNKIFGIPVLKLVNMSKKERIEAIRDSEIPDFKPEANLDPRWEYNEVIEIQCVCNNIFTFRNTETCDECGRKYKDEGRTVRKVREVQDNIDSDND